MARTFVKDPETGKPAIEVTNYQVIEITELEQAITDLATQRDAKQTDVDNTNATLEVQGTELVALEAQLDEAKSELSDAQGVVADPNAPVDSGTDADGSPVETPELQV